MYPLLFPNGEEGWFPDIPMANQDVRPSRKVPPLSSGVEVDDANDAGEVDDMIPKVCIVAPSLFVIPSYLIRLGESVFEDTTVTCHTKGVCFILTR
jgi:hypothetical protein